jgi:transposase
MFIAKVPNRRSPPAILLRESYREGSKVKSRTLANLTKLPPDCIEALRRMLKGEQLMSPEDVFDIERSYHHGHVQAILLAMKRLSFAQLLGSRACKERSLVQAMVAARLVAPTSKLAMTRWWNVTSLPSTLGVTDAAEDDLYGALDWLLKRQQSIEKKLAARHLSDGCLALYDLTSSYFEGTTCPLAARGHNRDGKVGKLQVNYGLLTDVRGCPVSVDVFEGNTADPKTLLPQVEKARAVFGINALTLVGDRGMITQKQVDGLKSIDGMDWITAMRPGAIKKLLNSGAIQMGLFDERNLFELSHQDFPGERLIACRNPSLAKRRADKRKQLIAATTRELKKVQNMVEGGRLSGKDMIEVRVRAILRGYRIGKCYQVNFREDGFDYTVDETEATALAIGNAQDDSKLAESRRERCKRHLETIANKLDEVRRRTEQGRLWGRDSIGVRVGKVVNKYQVAKHFKLTINDDSFSFEVKEDSVSQEAALDGIYVVRTSLPEQRLSADDTVRSYKLLSQVEYAFRSMKSIDIHVRPIHHRLEDRVRAHIFLCMLTYYVQWHMVQAWRSLLFFDEDLQAKTMRDPVAPAQRSDAALEKVRSRTLDDGSKVHSFQTLLTDLSSIVRNVCRITSSSPDAPPIYRDTNPTEKQQVAFDLLDNISL